MWSDFLPDSKTIVADWTQPLPVETTTSAMASAQVKTTNYQTCWLPDQVDQEPSLQSSGHVLWPLLQIPNECAGPLLSFAVFFTYAFHVEGFGVGQHATKIDSEKFSVVSQQSKLWGILAIRRARPC